MGGFVAGCDEYIQRNCANQILASYESVFCRRVRAFYEMFYCWPLVRSMRRFGLISARVE